MVGGPSTLADLALIAIVILSDICIILVVIPHGLAIDQVAETHGGWSVAILIPNGK
jgi:hypothetical protein